MAATRASGTNSVRYGTMRENVLSLKVVLPDGRVIRTASRARKSAAGYDLTRLFVGSEGTLGVITEVTVRLYGIPVAISAAVCSFASIEAAIYAVIQTIQAGVPVARIEVANAMQMDAINKYSKLDLPVAPTLWLEFHGTEASVVEQAEMVQKITAGHGGANFSWTTRPEDRKKLWRARQTSFTQTGRRAPAGRSSRPMSVCRFRGWPNALSRRRKTSQPPSYQRRLWPCRRRQLPLGNRAQSERPQGDGESGAPQRAVGASRAISRRHLYRRARHRLRQDRLPARRARRGGTRYARN